jgi:hypothetical protein
VESELQEVLPLRCALLEGQHGGGRWAVDSGGVVRRRRCAKLSKTEGKGKEVLWDGWGS